MKIQKMFMIDIELMEKLKQEANQSFLINKLLSEHYNMNSRTKEELKEFIRVEEFKIKQRQEMEDFLNASK